MSMRNSRGLKLATLLAMGVFGLSLIGCGGGVGKSSSHYTYDHSNLTPSPKPENALGGKIAVTTDDAPVDDTPVSFLLYYRTVDGNTGMAIINCFPEIDDTTNSSGEISVSLFVANAASRNPEFSTDNYNRSFKKLSLGGESSSPDVVLNEAVLFCERYGKKLPYTKNSFQ